MTVDAIHVQIVFPNTDGLAKDEFETSFNYTASAVDSAGMATLITNFFNSDSGGTQAADLCKYMSNSISRSVPTRILYYDVTGHLDGTPHGPAFQEDSFTLGAPFSSQVDMPNQCCGVLSYYDALDPEGTTRGRNRGRMFVGPINQSAVQNPTGPNPALGTNFANDMTIALKTMVNAMAGLTVPKDFAVWSRKSPSMVPAIGCWVNNDIATQRRRAWGPTSRTTLAF